MREEPSLVKREQNQLEAKRRSEALERWADGPCVADRERDVGAGFSAELLEGGQVVVAVGTRWIVMTRPS